MKNKMKKLLGGVLLVVLMLSLVTGCQNHEEKDAPSSDVVVETEENSKANDNSAKENGGSELQVGIILPTKDEPRWIQDQTRFQSILDDTGFTYQILFSQGSSATEKTNVETLISKGVEVLIIGPHDTSAVGAALEMAKDAGVIVIGYDRLISGTTAVDYNVGFNSESVGDAQANYLIDQVSGKGNPLYLYAGALWDENAFVFFEGAWKSLQPKIVDGTFTIKNSPEAEALKDKFELTREEMATILGQISTDWDFNVAKSKAESHLTLGSKEDKGEVFILAPNDGTARSIADVFLGDKEVTKYHITGQDAEKASIQYIIDGKQSMTVLKDTRMLTDAAVLMAKEILNGEEVSTNTTYNNGAKDVLMHQLPVLSITQDTLKQYIIDSDYYDASEFEGLE